jgi:hypothetical protein
MVQQAPLDAAKGALPKIALLVAPLCMQQENMYVLVCHSMSCHNSTKVTLLTGPLCNKQ